MPVSHCAHAGLLTLDWLTCLWGAGFRRETVWLKYKMVEVIKMAEEALDFNKSQDCMWSDATEEPF